MLNVVRKLVIVICAASLAWQPVALAQPVGIPSIGVTSSSDLSPSLERLLGDAIMEQGRRDPDYISDPDVSQYLTSVGRKLARYAPGAASQKITVFALRDKQINAFALPGGYIGINSGLIAATESESELASVIAHEVAHVMQRHIARGMTQSSQSGHIMLATIAGALLAALAGSGDLAMGVAAFGQAAAIDRQLGFSRQAEQEADRIGLEMMRKAGFDPRGMLNMFSRLSRSASLNEGMGGSVYARTHPLSTQRMSDIEGRVGQAAVNHKDNVTYWFIRAKLLALQSRNSQEQTRAAEILQRETGSSNNMQRNAANYGLAYLSFIQKKPEKATEFINNIGASNGSIAQVDELKILLALDADNNKHALDLATIAWRNWPSSQSIALTYVRALQRNNNDNEAIRFLESRIKQWPDMAELYQRMAFSLDRQGRGIEARRSMATYYELTGALPTAVEHLTQARNMTDDFYVKSELDVKIRELKDRLVSDRALLERFKL